MLKYYDCPELMKQQCETQKKDQYIEITDCLLAVQEKDMDMRELYEYAKILKAVLEQMDPMIYELYRALSDRFVDTMKEIFAKLKPDEEALESSQWKELLEFGVRKHFLLKEWFTVENIQSISTEGMTMPDIRILLVTPRSICFELCGSGNYETTQNYQVYINGHPVDTKQLAVRSVYGLLPSRDYVLTVIREDEQVGGCITFSTKEESVTLNVRDFGAVGDGKTDDTHAIQTAVMNCPSHGRVLIPEGCYRITSLFLRSNMQFELAQNAELSAIPERVGHGIQPGVLPSTDASTEYHFGSWEGNPEPMFSGILSGIEVENVQIYGEGVINGGANKENWWKNHRVMNMAYRPRLFFLRDCRNIALQGLTLRNSPAWTMHPFFSDDLGFYNLSVENPFDSPNTDGLDPESCRNIEIAGVRFSLGDDCIAVKAGKIYMGRKYKRASENISIRHCLMQDGHGAVTLGSEMAGGVRNLTVESCRFAHTDRGLRVKTRRGRGKDAVLDHVCFRNIEMDHVMTPFVVNSFYFCDPDGHTPYVQSRETLPVDDRTPSIRKLIFENIKAQNCHVAAAYIEGLPEAKVEELIMSNISVSYAEDAKMGVPAMSEGVEACSKKGIYIRNVKRVVFENVSVTGSEGKAIELIDVDEVVNTIGEENLCN